MAKSISDKLFLKIIKKIKVCAEKTNIMHELMHTLGFQHEQTREDRDKYIDIIYDNIANYIECKFLKKSLIFG